MDAKRGNAAGTRHGASKTSVASRHLNNANVARKYGSEVSLTPSQARHNADNPRKSPLDALSRLNNRQDPFQRRSGLQDVDDSFMATNAFARPSRVRNTGLDGGVQQGNQQVGNPAMAPLRVASGQEPQQQMQYQQQQQQPMQAAQPPVANMASSQQQQPAAAQQQQQQPQQQQQLPPVTVVPSQQSLQQQQQYVQPPAAGQPSRHDAYHGGRAHVQHQHQHYEQQQDAPAQGQVQAQQQQQQQQQPPAQVSPRKQQQQQQQMHQQQQGHAGQQSAGGGGASAAPPAAEMCTTCPNCQTTIYLVRTPEMGHGDGGMPMQ